MTDFRSVSPTCLGAVIFSLMVLTGVSPLLAADSSEEQEQWLAAHNGYRTLHGVPPVVWSEKLAASSRAFAESCPSAHSGTDYGENLSWASFPMSPQVVVDRWYAEEANYDYQHPGYIKGTGHFSQIIWKATRAIGCAWVTGCTPEHTLRANTWVCQYSPAGNFVSQFEENVRVPLPSR
jgi:uncharacterized protein YkwD